VLSGFCTISRLIVLRAAKPMQAVLLRSPPFSLVISTNPLFFLSVLWGPCSQVLGETWSFLLRHRPPFQHFKILSIPGRRFRVVLLSLFVFSFLPHACHWKSSRCLTGSLPDADSFSNPLQIIPVPFSTLRPTALRFPISKSRLHPPVVRAPWKTGLSLLVPFIQIMLWRIRPTATFS